MAVPTQPTLATLTTEGMKRAGYPSPTATQLTRAEWFVEETKVDLWNKSKKWKPLMITSYGVTAKGKSRYAMPSDFAQELSITILDGTHTGILQDAAAGTATLAAAESMTTEYAQGKLCLITSGTGVGSCSQITDYSDTTKIATVTPNFSTTPVATDTYMIVDTHYPLSSSPIWERDKEFYPHSLDTPSYFQSIGQGNADADETGEFELFPTPDDTYGIQLRYYASLLLLDLTAEVLLGLYRRWRNIFVQGVLVRQLQTDRDSRYTSEYQIYKRMIDELYLSEGYELNLSELQTTVSE